MPNIIENPGFRKRILDLVVDSGAFFNSTPTRAALPIMQDVPYLFDTDRLWAKPDRLKLISQLVIDALDAANVKYPVIGGITSRTGAFGTVPIATAIAYMRDLPLLVFEESSYSQYTVHPHSMQDNEQLCEQEFVLIKDAIIGGASLRRTYKTIVEAKGKLSAILILIDMNIYDKWQQDLPPDLPVIILARGPQFPELHNRNN